MVLIDSLKLLCVEETVDCDCPLDSGSMLAYVAPQQYSTALAAAANDEFAQSLVPHHPRRKLSCANGAKGTTEGQWDGEGYGTDGRKKN